MKFVILACLIAFAAAAPEQSAEVIQDFRDVRADGYNFNHETSNGILREEEGVASTNTGALAKSGRIEFPFPDGRIFVLSFTADEFGYHPVSEWLPVAPVV